MFTTPLIDLVLLDNDVSQVSQNTMQLQDGIILLPQQIQNKLTGLIITYVT
jgi:hypothetical protein